jgi:hypothetical protein
MNAPALRDLSVHLLPDDRKKSVALRKTCLLLAKTSLVVAFFLSAIGFLFLARAGATLQPLNHRVIDAEYSKALDKIITVSATPTNQIHVVDPISGDDRALGLSYVPTCVSVGPDGVHAAVGHNGHVSYVDLNTLTLLRTYDVTTDVIDVVLAGNGYVYAFPRVDQWEHIRCLNLETGQETLHTGMYVRAGTLAKLHPDGTKMYGANNGVSPSNIERYDITAGTAAYMYDSPYWGDYPVCGNLWMSEDGMRIFTACGKVFRSSDAVSEDMVYNGTLSGSGSIGHLDHSSEVNKVALIMKGSSFPTVVVKDTDIWIYQYDPLAYYTTVPLPPFPVGGVGYQSHGRFVFFNSAGSALFAIVQADTDSGTLLDYALATVDIEQGSKVYYTITASAGTGGAISPSGATPVIFGGSAGFTITADADYAISDVRVDGYLVGKVTSYTFENVEANHTIAVTFKPTFVGVMASAGPGGTINPSGLAKVSPGASLTFSITADAGYAISDVLVDGSSVGRVNSYTFNNIQTGHTIEATFGRAITVAPYYPLVPGTQWTYQKDGGTTEMVAIVKKPFTVNGVDTVPFQYSLTGAKEYYTNDGSGIRLHGTYSPKAYNNHPGTFTMSPPITIAPTQAVEGQTIHSGGIVRLTVPGLGHAEANYNADYTVDGLETITVTAGTFEAIKLTYNLTISDSTETGTLHLAKDIGQIRQTITYSGQTTTYELVSTNSTMRDLAVTNITRPATLIFRKSATSKTSPVKVVVQNRGPFPETITDQAMLSNVVTLAVHSLGSCADPVPAPVSPSKFPLTIPSKGSLTLTYNVTFDCVNDPARSTIKDPNHSDYRFTATVDRAAIDGDTDSHPSDDICPRPVTPPYAIDPYPDGMIREKGCGARKSDGTFGNELVTDIVTK